MQYEDPELVLADMEERMEKAVTVALDNLAKVRTGRASAGMLDGVRVDYYGQRTPLRQLANVTVSDPRTITIQPFDPSSVTAIERAIVDSGLGLTPNSSGSGNSRLIRINIPELSEERRRDYIKVARKEAEDGRVAVRNVRREANDALKKLEKDGTVSEDDGKRFHDMVQAATDKYIAGVDKALAQKEADLLKV